MNREIQVRNAKPKIKRRLRVAAYARVSTEKDTMFASLTSQISYYQTKIQENPRWVFSGVFADNAYTGTTSIRPEFNKLMEKARDHEIDMIITKSISRFARNTVILLESVRELKSLGVSVYFEEENINTLSKEGELILTILASYAQEESLSNSENIKWRINKNFREGKAWRPILLGYRQVDGRLEIHKEEAKTVKYIFKRFLAGISYTKIAEELNNRGYLTRQGRAFRHSSLSIILRNEYYVGDMMLQKTYTENHLTKRKKLNNGEFERYYIKDAHEPIIARADFERVQALLQKKKAQNNFKREQETYPFTSLVTCSACGAFYRRKRVRDKAFWMCGTYLDKGRDVCPAQGVPESELEAAVGKDLTKIKGILVKDKVITLSFKDGKERVVKWEYESRSKSWTKEMKKQASKNERERRKTK